MLHDYFCNIRELRNEVNLGRKDQRSCKRVREMDRSRKGDEGAVLWRTCVEEMSQKRVNSVEIS